MSGLHYQLLVKSFHELAESLRSLENEDLNDGQKEALEREDLKEDIRKRFAKNGRPCLMNSDYCESYIRNHPSCDGCSSEQPCRELTEFLWGDKEERRK